MGSKLILLLGIIVGALLTYFCIQDNKEHLALKYEKNKTVAQKHEETKTVALATHVKEQNLSEAKIVTSPPQTQTKTIALKKPSFVFSTKDKGSLQALVSSKDKTLSFVDFLDNHCTQDGCEKNVTFAPSTAKAPWQEEAIKIAAYLQEHHIPDATISIIEDNLTVSGQFPDQNSMDAFQKLLKPLRTSGLSISDNSKLTIPAQPEKAREEVNTTEPKPMVNLDDVQRKINIMLHDNPIYFKINSDKLLPKSKQTLDDIITLINDNKQKIALVVEGHTDASGDAQYNKYLSQKRANAVQDYLIENGLHATKIESIGYGEEKPLTTNPYKRENRRVEIHIKKGE